MAGELTGTRRAYDRCGGCGHARQRHQRGGKGACVQVTIVRTADQYGCPYQRAEPCRCPDFLEPTESE